MTAADSRELLMEFEQLAARAREFEAKLEEVRRLAERRRQLEAEVWGKAGSALFEEWEDSRRSVDAFYAAFGQVVDAAKARLEDVGALLGASDTERIGRALHAAGVRATREALERAVAGIREHVEAQQEERRSRRRAATQGGWIPESGRGTPRRASSAAPGGARGASGTGAGADTAASGGLDQERAEQNMAWGPESWRRDAEGRPGRWVAARDYSRITGIPLGTLANWRHQDRKCGRDEPAGDKPRYRRFGSAVGYWLPRSLEDPSSSWQEPRPDASGGF